MKQLTQQEKMSIVLNDDKLSELYLIALNERNVSYSRLNGHRIGKKKVGIQKLVLCQKAIAASIYDDNQ